MTTKILKLAILLIGTGAFVGMILFPQTEGRAVNLDLFEIYNDPFIIYIYIASIPFFIGLYQAFKLLNFIEAGKAFSQGAVNSLNNIKLACISFIGFIILALVYIRFFIRGEDPAGPTMLGFVAILASVIISTTAAVFQRQLQNAVNLKSENDLTI